MSDSEALIARLRRSNRRWKALALAACGALVLLALVGIAGAVRNRMQVEAAMRRINEAMEQSQIEAPNPGQPR
jgi:hypothetical protein